MREVEIGRISEAVAALCIKANMALPQDVCAALEEARAREDWPGARQVLAALGSNLQAAAEMQVPICQDTGVACVFIELGQEVHLTGGSLEQGVNEGVRRAYGEGYLRKSTVADPLLRGNTGDNSPALLHLELVPGEKIKLTVMPKGFGSENMSRIAMLKPADGRQGVVDFVLHTVQSAGANPCPPIVVGVGLGGSFDRAALLAKMALLRPIGSPHPQEYYALLERELLDKINRLGIGPAGYGGKTTALGLAIETFPTHIAGLPVAVNISCHVTRRASAWI